jgi:hypothetical protein
MRKRPASKTAARVPKPPANGSPATLPDTGSAAHGGRRSSNGGRERGMLMGCDRGSWLGERCGDGGPATFLRFTWSGRASNFGQPPIGRDEGGRFSLTQDFIPVVTSPCMDTHTAPPVVAPGDTDTGGEGVCVSPTTIGRAIRSIFRGKHKEG